MKINKKTLKIISVACIALFLVLLCFFAITQIKYCTYKKVEAKIVSVDSKYGSGTNSKSRIHYVTYQYEVDDKLYEAKTQVFTQSGKNIGDKVIIKYKPDEPYLIENKYTSQSLLFLVIFIGVFTILLRIIIFRNKNTKA